MKMTVSWDVTPCSLIEIDRRLTRGATSQKTLMFSPVLLCELLVAPILKVS
jgi:hypothetical protein